MKAVEVIKKIAEDEVKKLHIVELGIVTSVYPHADESDKDNYECNVKLKNRDLELRKVPIATQHIGLTNIPNIGDLVILTFVNGNINAPIVIGRLYNEENRPPANKAGEIIFESPEQEKDGVRRMCLKFPNNIILTITDDELKAEAGKSIVTIKTDGDIIITSNAKLDIKAEGDITFSARNIKMESQQAIDLIAGTTAKVEASGTLDIKGKMVNIN